MKQIPLFTYHMITQKHPVLSGKSYSFPVDNFKTINGSQLVHAIPIVPLLERITTLIGCYENGKNFSPGLSYFSHRGLLCGLRPEKIVSLFLSYPKASAWML
jgi:hypothetical protein